MSQPEPLCSENDERHRPQKSQDERRRGVVSFSELETGLWFPDRCTGTFATQGLDSSSDGLQGRFFEDVVTGFCDCGSSCFYPSSKECRAIYEALLR